MEIMIGNIEITADERPVCQYFLEGRCRFGSRCWNSHLTKNEVVQKKKYKSNNARRRNGDTNSSTASETASAVTPAKSEDSELTCGICFDAILSKSPQEKVFGILPNCNHCFCFSCICRWRKSKEFELEVSKACPECRVASDYVYPSRVWVDSKEEKERMIKGRKERMLTRDCKYFRQGKGLCPFGNTCLYRHMLPDGQKVDVGPPKPRRVREFGFNNIQQLLFLMENEQLSDDEDLDFDDLDMYESDYNMYSSGEELEIGEIFGLFYD